MNNMTADNINSLNRLTSMHKSNYRDSYKDTLLENKKIFYNEMADLLNFEDVEKQSVFKMLKSADEETLQILKELFKARLNNYINK